MQNTKGAPHLLNPFVHFFCVAQKKWTKEKGAAARCLSRVFLAPALPDAADARMEVSGSLDPTDGLSALYQEKNKQYVIVNPPKTIEELKKIAISYFKNDKYWKNNIKWN